MEVSIKKIGKKIGIWGLGIVGKSALHYFINKNNIALTVMDKKMLSAQEQELLETHNIPFMPQHQCEQFLEENDLILASPGIDLRPFYSYSNKFITELDIISQECKQRTIAITGTVGKTSITHLLSSIIQNHTSVITAGNIGKGMLDIINAQEKNILLEVSSFQLEHCNLFAPDLAIWTNFFPNHLDRHTTLDNYFNAKYKIIAHQKKGQQALLPLELASTIMHKKKHTQNCKGTLNFFSLEKPCLHTYAWLPQESSLFWIEDGIIIRYTNGTLYELLEINNLENITFSINWLIITAALSLLTIPVSSIMQTTPTLPEHRIEKVGVYNTIEFYNDSKATIIESTLAALDKLSGKPTILFLGGLSKGIDRLSIFSQLRGKIKYLICFGTEAERLHTSAHACSITSSSFATLHDAFNFSLTIAQPGDQILFSPGGSSYDLFSNYEERGNTFKQLVKNIVEKNNL